LLPDLGTEWSGRNTAPRRAWVAAACLLLRTRWGLDAVHERRRWVLRADAAGRWSMRRTMTPAAACARAPPDCDYEGCGFVEQDGPTMSDSCSPDKRCPDQRCAGSGASAGGSEELLLKRAHASKTPPSTKHKNKRRSGSSSPASTQSTRQFRPTEGGNACLAHAASRVLLPLPPPTPPLLPSPRFADCRQRPSHAANRKLDIGTSQSTDGEGGSQAITCAQAASLDEGDEGSHDAPAPAPAPATVPALICIAAVLAAARPTLLFRPL